MHEPPVLFRLGWFFGADRPHLASIGRSQYHDYVMDACNFAEYTAYITPRGLQYAGKSSIT